FRLSSILTGFSIMMIASPMIGELIATTSPLWLEYPKQYVDLTYENVTFPTSDGLTLRGWFFPTSNADAPAILYAPATAKDQRQGLSLVEPLHKAGFQVLLFSYRGTGASDGNRFMFSYGARESIDVDAAVQYLSKTRGVKHIGAIGHSAGAVSIILSAARNPAIDALVVAAPFSTLQDIWSGNRPSILSPDLFGIAERIFEWRKNFSRSEVRPVDVIDQISPRPILFVNGTADKRINAAQATVLYEKAQFPKRIIWLQNATHAEVRSPGLDNLVPAMVEFFNAHLNRSMARNCQAVC
ncbi:alpha/beta hydrolase, partial [bacterium]|nr:alpha/beta hydrolase [bacterium]